MPYGPEEEYEVVKLLRGERTVDLSCLAIVVLELRERIAKLEEKIDDSNTKDRD